MKWIGTGPILWKPHCKSLSIFYGNNVTRISAYAMETTLQKSQHTLWKKHCKDLNIFYRNNFVRISVYSMETTLQESQYILWKQHCKYLGMFYIQISNFMNIRPVGAEMFHVDRRTDMTKSKVGFAILRRQLKSLNWCMNVTSVSPTSNTVLITTCLRVNFDRTSYLFHVHRKGKKCSRNTDTFSELLPTVCTVLRKIILL
jgi:hypothetical protein